MESALLFTFNRGAHENFYCKTDGSTGIPQVMRSTHGDTGCDSLNCVEQAQNKVNVQAAVVTAIDSLLL
jgi:hypothetical protein